ncbi:Marine sediment metagenome DNA, contig: S01H1_S14958 OS=marine sediment metagenome GN=S01H1_46430 PE=4 SV=1: Zn-ribbon_8 [Gemmata massiliana]|uniref:Putative regulatory protein FmdB zinc ribbon domain-containing protein n=1 Tax=Gemmata massiliana TaxID=1210884 RepID=A0A6P2CWC9_9BACT|nr:zinc ribbon domain-containing protein [Gemmata massiliana]VTR92696.1 Marine sediment metagenome DNA, contig: S01H1_S14958 OS=marine sediment metagenome GN=S01H1_46430 PE=4 SV=1: Zn-ribbon_8 [Gemmata massiliana]
MPTYDYRCSACGHTFDELQKFSDAPLTKCPACKKNKLERLFGGGGAIIFKGGGFYETDYRRAGEKRDDAGDKGDSGTGKTETKETKAETPAPAAESAPKTETKSESKSGGAKKKGK